MISLSTIIFLLIRILSNPTANVFQKKLSAEISSFTINLYTYLILSICCIPFVHTYLKSAILTAEFFILVFTAGFLCAAGTLCIIKAVNLGELSVIGPINSYKSVIGLASAFILLKEIPSLYALIGIALIIQGSRLTFETTKEGFSFSLLKRRDIQLRFTALFLTGIEAAILKKIIIMSGAELCFIFWCFTGLFWSMVFSIVFKKNIKVKSADIFLQLIFISICMGLMQLSTNYVFKHMNVSCALALFQLSSIVTVLFGFGFFHEKSVLQKLAGTFIMIIGSVLIIIF